MNRLKRILAFLAALGAAPVAMAQPANGWGTIQNGWGELKTSAGGGVSTTGSPVSGQVALFSGAASLTGDTGATYTGTGATAKFTIGGITFGGSAASGTGLYLSAANTLGFTTNGTERWVMNASGAFNPTIDATYDIGTSLVRPRDLTISRNFVGGGTANRIGTATTADALADTLLATSATTQKGLVVQMKASQTANPFEVQTSAGVPATRVQSDGGLIVDQRTAATYSAMLEVMYQGTSAFQVNAGGIAINPSGSSGSLSIAGGYSILYGGTGANGKGLQLYDSTSNNYAGISVTTDGSIAVGKASGAQFSRGDATGSLKATNLVGPGTTTTLTESAATGFATLTYSASTAVSVELLCRIQANDATDFQSLTSRVRVSSVRKATGNTVSTVNAVGTDLLAESAGGSTLTCTFTVTEGASAATVNANCVSSLTQTTLNISFLAESVGQVTIAKL